MNCYNLTNLFEFILKFINVYVIGRRCQFTGTLKLQNWTMTDKV